MPRQIGEHWLTFRYLIGFRWVLMAMMHSFTLADRNRGAVLRPDTLNRTGPTDGNRQLRIRARRSLSGKLVAFVAKEVDAGFRGLGVVQGATVRQHFIQRYLNAP
jgi:hypothetical protein